MLLSADGLANAAPVSVQVELKNAIAAGDAALPPQLSEAQDEGVACAAGGTVQPVEIPMVVDALGNNEEFMENDPASCPPIEQNDNPATGIVIFEWDFGDDW